MTGTVRVLVSGSRTWTDERAVWAQLDAAWAQLGPFTLVHGACPEGADAQAARWADARHGPVEPHPADWGHHTPECPRWHRTLPRCRAAGYRRNKTMVDAGADLCLVFCRDRSPGATMTARLAVAAGIPTWLFAPDRPARLLAAGAAV